MSLIQRLPARIQIKIAPEPNTGCWLWTASVNTTTGYAQVRAPGSRQCNGHRYVYETLVGPVPAGMHLDHLCRVRSCVNPDHLEPVTPGENLRRSPLVGRTGHKKRTHCKRGHEFGADNFYVIRATGQRTCRTCTQDRERIKYRRRTGSPGLTKTSDGKWRKRPLADSGR